jgi:hypothetical protein
LRATILCTASFIVVLAACRAQSNVSKPFTGDISSSSSAIHLGEPQGKLYVRGDHLRADWGAFADVFDLRTRTGFRLLLDSKTYQELGTKDLSTYSPETENGSPCPRAQVPAACHYIDDELLDGVAVKKWDLLNPGSGGRVLFWTDSVRGITLRMDIVGAAIYEVKNLKNTSVPDSLFQIPAGFSKIERPFRP